MPTVRDTLKQAMEIEEARDAIFVEQEAELQRLKEFVEVKRLLDEKAVDLATIARLQSELDAARAAPPTTTTDHMPAMMDAMDAKHKATMVAMEKAHAKALATMEQRMREMVAAAARPPVVPQMGPMQFDAIRTSDGRWKITCKE